MRGRGRILAMRGRSFESGSAPVPVYYPALIYSDERNSMYIGAGI